MARATSRLRIDDEGQLEIVDPGFDSLELLQLLDPEFSIKRSALARFTAPSFLSLRTTGCALTIPQLAETDEADLWELHNQVMKNWLASTDSSHREKNEASVLGLKVELCRRVITNCRLCAHRCGINRTIGELGVCRLAENGIVAEHFVHIAEESPINPSLVLNLAGCGLRCRFCQQSALLTPETVPGEPLNSALWEKFDTREARSLSFVGGNPDESLYAILRFLESAPANWLLPLVWNCHSYATLETLSLLEGVVDVYVPDFKYGNDACGLKLSAVSHYTETAQTAIQAMLEQDVPVMIRILVLPGHLECCHLPGLKFLASLPQNNLRISVRGQYCPDWKITQQDGLLARRVTSEEADCVRQKALDLGLSLVD
jgi:putative pyruvate formate lyase activating enzyme